ncbi:MAG TPA: hypothetical protein VG841_10125 [Caulobacterales bacterium]|nr:hypothetical protein [Caulobacterales bacterium]
MAIAMCVGDNFSGQYHPDDGIGPNILVSADSIAVGDDIVLETRIEFSSPVAVMQARVRSATDEALSGSAMQSAFAELRRITRTIGDARVLCDGKRPTYAMISSYGDPTQIAVAFMRRRNYCGVPRMYRRA